jgi:hypothetical protein
MDGVSAMRDERVAGKRGRVRKWLIAAIAASVLAAGVAVNVESWRDEARKAQATAEDSEAPADTSSATPAAEATGAATATSTPLTEIQNMLEARAGALVRGSLAQFLAFTDPANAKLVQRDKQLFANFRKLGVRLVDYQLSPDFTPERRPKLGPTARAFRLATFVQIGGIDPAARYSEVGYTFAKRGGHWLLVDDDDTAAANHDGTLEPWELGPIEVARGRGVLVVTSPGEGWNGRRLVREAEAAMPSVQTATKRAQAGVLVVAMADRRSFPQTSIGGEPAGAVAMRNYVATDANLVGFKTIGSRVVINPSERKTTDREVLAHEFTHAAVSPLGENAPTWLVEGYAEYVERHLAERRGQEWVAAARRKLRRTALKSLAAPPNNNVFYDREDNYGVSWLIVEYLVNKYGLPEFNALYADLATGLDDPAAHDQTLRKHLKLTGTTLVAAVKKYTGPS